jgi:hypothetical protein
VNTLITKSRRVAMLAILSLIASMFLAMQATLPANAAQAVITFEADDGSYTTAAFNGVYGVAEAPTVPLTGGGSKSLKIVHNGQYSGITVLNLDGYEIVSSAGMTVTAKIYSPTVGTAIRLKLEGVTSLEKDFVTTAVGWQDASWDFSTGLPQVYDYWNNGPVFKSQVISHSTNYNKAVILPNTDVAGAGEIYYVDNLTFNKTSTCTPVATPTLASMDSNSNADITLSAFEGATASVEKAPAGGSQGNVNAIRLAKPSGNPWGGAQIINSTCTTYGGATKVTANVWAPAAGLPFRLALEGSGAQFVANGGNDPVTWRAGWQQMSWDISGVTGFRGVVIIFPDFLGPVGADKVFFIDDIAFNGATSPLWGNNLMNISQPTMNEADQGKYVHVRLQKTFIGSSYDASWWDGIREYRDADTRAYVKYLGARSTFSLTYKVTDANGAPMTNTPVELIVNANYSCSKATFTYGSTEIGRDDCGGKGETRLPKKNTDGNGEVTFVLTNTNAKGEAMPSSLSSPPTVGVANEIGSNIQPYVADKQGFDMLLVHFVEPTGGATLSGAASAEMNVNTKTPVTFKLKDAKGAAIAGVDVKFVSDGVGSVGRTATTDADGNVSTFVNNSSDASGTQIVSATYVGTGGFPASASTVIQWTSTKPAVTAVGAKGMVTVTIKNGVGKNARISVAGSATVSRKLSSNSSVVKLRSSAGSKVVTVTIDGVATKLVVQVPK